MLTFQLTVLFLGPCTQDSLSFQEDFCWIQIKHLDPDSRAEDSYLSWQVIDCQHLLFTRCKGALQGQERRKGLHQRFDEGRHRDRQAEKTGSLLEENIRPRHFLPSLCPLSTKLVPPALRCCSVSSWGVARLQPQHSLI